MHTLRSTFKEKCREEEKETCSPCFDDCSYATTDNQRPLTDLNEWRRSWSPPTERRPGSRCLRAPWNPTNSSSDTRGWQKSSPSDTRFKALPFSDASPFCSQDRAFKHVWTRFLLLFLLVFFPPLALSFSLVFLWSSLPLPFSFSRYHASFSSFFPTHTHTHTLARVPQSFPSFSLLFS